MKNHTISICVGVLAAFAIAGCGVSDKDVTGSWTGKPTSAGASGGMASAFADMMSVQLELKSDHTYTMMMLIFPVEGSWKVKGNTVILTRESFMGMSSDELARARGQSGADEPMVLRVSKDRKTMTGTDTNSATSAELVFTRN